MYLANIRMHSAKALTQHTVFYVTSNPALLLALGLC